MQITPQGDDTKGIFLGTDAGPTIVEYDPHGDEVLHQFPRDGDGIQNRGRILQ